MGRDSSMVSSLVVEAAAVGEGMIHTLYAYCERCLESQRVDQRAKLLDFLVFHAYCHMPGCTPACHVVDEDELPDVIKRDEE